MKTTFKLILMLGFLCLLKPETTKAQSFPTHYAIMNQTACNLTYDIVVTDLNGTCISASGVSINSGINDIYDLAASCGAVQDITVTINSISVSKVDINNQVLIGTCAANTTMQWAYGGVIIQ